MIASVSGEVSHIGLDHVVVVVGGLGLRVHVTPGTAASLRLRAPVTLSTSLVVREDALTIYGFADDDSRALFELVQTVTGVGPRLALAMLAVHPPDALRGAIASGDVVALMKVPGVGKKGAERLVLELRDKVGLPGGSAASPVAASGSAWEGQVKDALIGLGWSAKQAEDAVAAVGAEEPAAADVSSLLRAALKRLARV
ncbi:MAG: Holliday junction branch migration protein RuvA [Dermatophilaceae bacterium]|nr:Holliday junction branch migration protein RuvA [Dermatophilaceae bacterium]MBP9917677.1 Holliday junction branch migration protein RuvA [Dermatophilaceae bacterium]